MKTFKIVVLGHGDVGKTSITMQYIYGKFVDYYNPTVEDLYTKIINHNETPIKLEILDTAGFDQFTSMRDLYIKNGDGFIIVYSILNRKTFINLKTLKDHILQIKGSKSVPIVLVGNKLDLAENGRDVNIKDAESLAYNWQCSLHEVSARSQDAVNGVFKDIATKIVNCSKPTQSKCSVV